MVVACLGFFFLRAKQAGTGMFARIYLNGEQIREIALHETDDYRISLMKDYGTPVSFEVKGGTIRFVDVDCPDHVCEKTGALSTDGQTATCMPNRTAAHVVSLES